MRRSEAHNLSSNGPWLCLLLVKRSVKGTADPEDIGDIRLGEPEQQRTFHDKSDFDGGRLSGDGPLQSHGNL